MPLQPLPVVVRVHDDDWLRTELEVADVQPIALVTALSGFEVREDVKHAQ